MIFGWYVCFALQFLLMKVKKTNKVRTFECVHISMENFNIDFGNKSVKKICVRAEQAKWQKTMAESKV